MNDLSTLLYKVLAGPPANSELHSQRFESLHSILLGATDKQLEQVINRLDELESNKNIPTDDLDKLLGYLEEIAKGNNPELPYLVYLHGPIAHPKAINAYRFTSGLFSLSKATNRVLFESWNKLCDIQEKNVNLMHPVNKGTDQDYNLSAFVTRLTNKLGILVEKPISEFSHLQIKCKKNRIPKSIDNLKNRTRLLNAIRKIIDISPIDANSSILWKWRINVRGIIEYENRLFHTCALGNKILNTFFNKWRSNCKRKWGINMKFVKKMFCRSETRSYLTKKMSFSLWKKCSEIKCIEKMSARTPKEEYLVSDDRIASFKELIDMMTYQSHLRFAMISKTISYWSKRSLEIEKTFSEYKTSMNCCQKERKVIRKGLHIIIRNGYRLLTDSLNRWKQHSWLVLLAQSREKNRKHILRNLAKISREGVKSAFEYWKRLGTSKGKIKIQQILGFLHLVLSQNLLLSISKGKSSCSSFKISENYYKMSNLILLVLQKWITSSGCFINKRNSIQTNYSCKAVVIILAIKKIAKHKQTKCFNSLKKHLLEEKRHILLRKLENLIHKRIKIAVNAFKTDDSMNIQILRRMKNHLKCQSIDLRKDALYIWYECKPRRIESSKRFLLPFNVHEQFLKRIRKLIPPNMLGKDSLEMKFKVLKDTLTFIQMHHLHIFLRWKNNQEKLYTKNIQEFLIKSVILKEKQPLYCFRIWRTYQHKAKKFSDYICKNFRFCKICGKILIRGEAFCQSDIYCSRNYCLNLGVVWSLVKTIFIKYRF